MTINTPNALQSATSCEDQPATKDMAVRCGIAPWIRNPNWIAAAAAATVSGSFIGLHGNSHCEDSMPSSSSQPLSQPSSSSYQSDVAPNFNRHGKHSLIRKYLTESMYNDLKDSVTPQGVRLEDLIRAAVSLPFGAKPPRGIAGVYAGDAESYEVFAPLLDKLIAAHHHSSTAATKKGLRRHRTNLNPKQLQQQRLDPDGQYILTTRMRLARSIAGFRFAPCIRRDERRTVEAIVRECVGEWRQPGTYEAVVDMSNERHQELLQKQLIFPNPDVFACSAGTHRDWPDARGVYCDDWDNPEILIWCNHEDHLWIISNAKGGDVQGVFSRLSTSVWAMETSLAKRGYAFVEDGRLGFLNTSPANIGPALRASVAVKLVRLGRMPGFPALVARLRLEARAYEEDRNPQTTPSSNIMMADYDDRRYTGIFDIGNAETLGKSEVELINVMIEGVGKLIDLEKRLENGETVNLSEIS